MRPVMWTLLLIGGLLLSACSSPAVATTTPVTEDPAPRETSDATPLPTDGSGTAMPDSSPGPTALPNLNMPTATPYPDTPRFQIGESVEKRPLWAWRFGDGEQRIVLVGGLHGGYEANSTRLSEEMIEHFQSNPADVLPGIELYIIPAANPDGLAQGTELEARFNANDVDLNRNWGCDWADIAYIRDIEVSPGPRPFSEPETQALRAFFLAVRPDAVIFYHSQLSAVFVGSCGGQTPGDWLGHLLEEATGYTYDTSFDYYEVTGDATDWLAERDIPAAVIELTTRQDTEFWRNMRGVMALQCALLTQEQDSALSPIVTAACQ